MNKLFSFFVLIACLNQTGFADFRLENRLFVPWGETAGQIPLKETPSGWRGVESFEVTGETTHILTSFSRQIISFSGQNLKSIQEVRIPGARDFLFDNSGKLKYVMDSRKIYEVRAQTYEILWVNPWEMQANSRLLKTNKDIPIVLLDPSRTISLDSPQSNPHSGVLNRLGQYGRMIRQSNSEMILVINDAELALLRNGEGVWGSGQYLGVNDYGDHYVLLETILKQFPLKIKREVRIISDQGISIAALDVPGVLNVPVTREFQIDGNGSVFELITSENGTHIVEWMFSGSHADFFTRTPLPVEYQNIKVRPFQGDSTIPPPFNQDEKIDNDSDSSHRLDFPPVGREEALSTAAEYVDLIWTATSANLTNGLITDPDGHAVQTPDWIQVGQNQRMAYQWGGFSTIDGYLSGLANGKYAGDMATSAVSNYAVGVDCSGFVSRCWNMPQHYSTWMMSNTQPLITLPHDSWYDLQSGDALHKVGHVRLAVLWNTNGTILAVEAGGGWITHYQSYSISQLFAYQPRYYVNMEGMPATIEQPVLNNVCYIDSNYISWSLTDTTGIHGFHLYQKDIFQPNSWEILTDDLIPVEQTTFFLPLTDLSLAYQLRSVSNNEEATESYPSDAYALAHKGSDEKLLIVDGFDRTTGSYPFPYHEFALDMAKALGHFTYSFETIDNDAVLEGIVSLADYTAVFWLLGDESTSDETFSDSEQDLIESYLTGGGKLFVSGSEVAWDLDSQGTSSDRTFFLNYLKAAYGADDSESYVINGVSGTPFAGLSLNFDDGNNGVYKEDYPDAFAVSNGSQAVLRYANNLIASTAYTGTFGSGTATGQVILLGIPFETIYIEDQRLNLVAAILEYFELSTVLPINEKAITPATQLLKPFPSPFNSISQIRFQLNQASKINLQVFDLRGRKITTLSQDHYEAGTWQLPFNADGLPGGLYLIQLRTENFHQTQKVIYLK